jgi:hypothetical protein
MSVMYLIFREDAFNSKGVIAGFGMGATTLSFFSRVGGGIFTKAADVGAGKYLLTFSFIILRSCWKSGNRNSRR